MGSSHPNQCASAPTNTTATIPSAHSSVNSSTREREPRELLAPNSERAGKEPADNRHTPFKLDLRKGLLHFNDSPTWLLRLIGVIVQVMSNSRKRPVRSSLGNMSAYEDFIRFFISSSWLFVVSEFRHFYRLLPGCTRMYEFFCLSSYFLYALFALLMSVRCDLTVQEKVAARTHTIPIHGARKAVWDLQVLCVPSCKNITKLLSHVSG